MATKVQAPQLTPNNRIYLYQLLSRELGCGKQTFMPAVEEALARDRMTSDDLGFESTRALLEALEEFIKLTVFKGGRIYATVMAQPAWDEALAALESGKAKDAGAPSNKPWKRKKADKTLKPVRPKRVKRPEPAPEPEPIVKTEAVESPSLPGAAAQTRAEETEATSENTNADAVNIPEDTPATETAEAVEVVEAAETAEAAETVEVVETIGIHEEASLTEPDDARVCAEEDPQPSPAVSLTVTYDPYSGIDRETKLESHLISPKPDQAPLEPACAPSQLATNPAPLSVAPASLSPAVLATYPTDFSTEVYLASELIADLCELLPYGTDVFTLLAEDYARARTLELISGTRARATFPLRIQHADSIEPIRVTLKKRGGTGLQWELSAVE